MATAGRENQKCCLLPFRADPLALLGRGPLLLEGALRRLRPDPLRERRLDAGPLLGRGARRRHARPRRGLPLLGPAAGRRRGLHPVRQVAGAGRASSRGQGQRGGSRGREEARRGFQRRKWQGGRRRPFLFEPLRGRSPVRPGRRRAMEGGAGRRLAGSEDRREGPEGRGGQR